MTLNQLKYAVEVSKTLSMNRAAQNLFVSQSVISISIKNLEKELGDAIFYRSTQGISITPFGRIFLNYATPLVTQFDQLNSSLQPRRRQISAQKLAVVTNGYTMADIFSQLYERYGMTGVQLTHYEAFEMEAMTMVANGIADFAIVRFWTCYDQLYKNHLQSLNLEFSPLKTVNIGISIGPRNPLFYQKTHSVKACDLRVYPAVVYNYMYAGPFSDIFQRLGLPLGKSCFITGSRAALYEILNQTDAYYLNSCYTWGDRPSISTYRTLKLSDCSVKSTVGIVFQKEGTLSQIAKDTIDLVTELFEQLS